MYAFFLDIAKHFGGLQITDFPLYVQGLEFKQSSGNSNNNKVSQSVVLTKPVKQATGNFKISLSLSLSKQNKNIRKYILNHETTQLVKQ